MNKIDQVDENIFISGEEGASDYDLLKNLGITHILVVTRHQKPLYKEDFFYKTIPIDDEPEENILKYFRVTNIFIELALADNGKVLVHCGLGISRSTTILIAYFMRSKRMSYEQSYNFVRTSRRETAPNGGFVKQLLEYEKIINRGHYEHLPTKAPRCTCQIL